MQVLVTSRHEGKTTKLMEWVSNGTAVKEYPFWSRVVIVVDLRSYNNIKRNWWGKIDDFDHRVYTWHDIQQGRFHSRHTEYRIDDFDAFIPLFFSGLYVGGFTMTASKWENEPCAPCDMSTHDICLYPKSPSDGLPLICCCPKHFQLPEWYQKNPGGINAESSQQTPHQG